MNNVIRAVERIQSVPGAQVDRNFRQGRDAVLAQAYYLRTDEGVNNMSVVGKYITHIQESLAEVHAWVQPYHLPDDYVFFLEFYGGLLIERPRYNLLVLGIGPMVEEWYGFIKGDEGAYENGWLLIASLTLKEERIGHYVDFFLDLAGSVHKYCVIGIPTGGISSTNSLQVIRDLDAHPDHWSKITSSFTEWLELAAKTKGSFGYA